MTDCFFFAPQVLCTRRKSCVHVFRESAAAVLAPRVRDGASAEAGGSHLPGRATRTMRGDASLAAAAASTAALCARRHGPARGAASSARRHPKDAAPRALLGYRSRRTTAKTAAGASDDVFDEGKSIRAFFVASRVARRRARVADDPLAPHRPRWRAIFLFLLHLVLGRLSDGDDDASTQRPIRTRARARRGGTDITSALPLARAVP